MHILFFFCCFFFCFFFCVPFMLHILFKFKWRGFFRGLSYPLLTYGAVNAVIFGVYGYSLRLICRDRQPTLWDVYLAGCVAGTGQLILCNPVDVIKCTMQSQIPHQGMKYDTGHL